MQHQFSNERFRELVERWAIPIAAIVALVLGVLVAVVADQVGAKR